MKIGQSFDVVWQPRVQFGLDGKFLYMPRPRWRRDRYDKAIGRVWRLSQNTYRFELYGGSFRTFSAPSIGKATTFNSALYELIRRYKNG